MKDHPVSDAIGLLGDDLVAEAAPAAVRRRTHGRIVRYCALAAAAAILLTALLWLFVPYTVHDVSRFEGDPYYQVIDKLNDCFQGDQKTDTNFRRLFLNNGLNGTKLSGNIGTGSVYDEGYYDRYSSAQDQQIKSEDSETLKSGYVETTDNQVQGVVEGDLLKRSDRYAFYLRHGGKLSVYSVEGEDSRAIVEKLDLEKILRSRIETLDTIELSGQEIFYRNGEMFLTRDCAKLIVIMNMIVMYKRNGDPGYPEFGAYWCIYTAVMVVDVAEPEMLNRINAWGVDPSGADRINVTFLSGFYGSSRYSGDELLVITRFYANDREFQTRNRYIPNYFNGEEFVFVDPSDIIIPENVRDSVYTTLTKIDVRSASVRSVMGLLGGAETVYVTEKRVFLASSAYRTVQFPNAQYKEPLIGMEPITRVNVIDRQGEELTCIGEFEVDGSVKNQYAMDEKDGILRVFTSTGRLKQPAAANKGSLVRSTNASLYCIDLQTLESVAAVRDFAPEGESVQSVRFDADRAYVCTSVVLQDPVFVFDLSDYSRITYADTGVIDGYSYSLIDFGEGLALGIGYGEDWRFKIELYEKKDEKVASICRYQPEDILDAPTNYKAFLIDRQNARIGFSTVNRKYDENGAGEEKSEFRYTILRYDAEQLKTEYSAVLSEIDFSSYDEPDYARAFIHDGFVYVFTQKNGFSVGRIG